MQFRKMLAALLAALAFVGLMMLIDRNISPESFEKVNYWIKPVAQGILMFVVYLLPEHIKNLSWKQLSGKSARII